MNFLEALTIVFVVAKLWRVVEWSWWQVLGPLWVTWGLGGLVTVYYVWVKAPEGPRDAH